ncbi:serine/threonine-protein phosphatase [bacterium]|jgi:phosphoserine phosphatase RsbU/P|nr:serine/threonine-protein phosphatase [bacterium]MBT3581358.1 serine/threonine-protein phosphatase [bacterium]MBT4552091.1 serine/threonine-protein phosphatase [bacterium]MBT7088378.1 serine/threonine-protein phosphatase [bacterium]
MFCLWKKKKKKPAMTFEELPKKFQKAVFLAEKYAKELAMANKVQKRMMEKKLPRIKGVKIAKKFLPAEVMGGDFYGFLTEDFDSCMQKTETPGIVTYEDKQDEYLDIILGDVAGHGVSSSLVMALSAGIISELGRRLKSPAEVLRYANNDILGYIENSEVPFVTVFYASFNLNTKVLYYAKGGHPAPLLVHKDGVIEELNADGAFLGMFEDEQYEEKQKPLVKGDRVYFYTDGIVEARNKQKNFFGLEKFQKLILANQEETVEKAISNIFAEVKKFCDCGSLSDDVSLVILEIK